MASAYQIHTSSKCIGPRIGAITTCLTVRFVSQQVGKCSPSGNSGPNDLGFPAELVPIERWSVAVCMETIELIACTAHLHFAVAIGARYGRTSALELIMHALPSSGNLIETFERSLSAQRSPNGSREPTEIDGVVYKIADCLEEREAAFRLIHDAYTLNGLMAANPSGMRITPYHLLPTSDLFVAYHEGNAIYTMTLISDDQQGIPLERVFKSEVLERRNVSGAYLAEVSCLASRVGYLSRGQMYHVFVRLASLMVQSARENGVERLMIACHPRHARFYEGLLGFKRVSEPRNYAPVKNKLAVVLEHDFALQDSRPYRLYQRIYGHTFRHWELYHQPMLKEERDHFAEITELYETYFPIEGVA